MKLASGPHLKPNEQSLLEMHSLLNIFNVLRGELSLIGIQKRGVNAAGSFRGSPR